MVTTRQQPSRSTSSISVSSINFSIVRDQPRDRRPRIGEHLFEVLLDRRAAFVLIHARARAIRDGHDADLARHAHAPRVSHLFVAEERCPRLERHAHDHVGQEDRTHVEGVDVERVHAAAGEVKIDHPEAHD